RARRLRPRTGPPRRAGQPRARSPKPRVRPPARARPPPALPLPPPPRARPRARRRAGSSGCGLAPGALGPAQLAHAPHDTLAPLCLQLGVQRLDLGEDLLRDRLLLLARRVLDAV